MSFQVKLFTPFLFQIFMDIFSFMFFIKMSSLNQSLLNLMQSLHKMTEKSISEKNYQ